MNKKFCLWKLLNSACLVTALSFSMLIGPVFAQETIEPLSVSVVAVDEREMIGRVPISGTLVPREEVLIYPQVNGYPIDAIFVDIGDTVDEGDVLARVNSQTLVALLAQAEAELARATASLRQALSQITAAEASLTQTRSALTRAQQLGASGSGTQANLDQAVASEGTARANLASATGGFAVASAQLQQAQAQVDIARLNLEHAEIVAPVDGLVAARNGHVGAIANASGEPVFRLIVGGQIEVEAEVLETAISAVVVQTEVQLEVAGIGPVTGAIRLISPTVDPVTRLGTIRIETDTHPALRAGLFASGWVITDRRLALTVPATAVLADANGSYVQVVNEGEVDRRDVTVGLVWLDHREIVTGLELGEIVISRAGAFFSDGDIVTPMLASDGASE